MLTFEGLNDKQWTQIALSIYSEVKKSINEMKDKNDIEHCKGLIEWYRKNIVISYSDLEETFINRSEEIKE